MSGAQKGDVGLSDHVDRDALEQRTQPSLTLKSFEKLRAVEHREQSKIGRAHV